MATPVQLDFVTRKNCPLCEKGLRSLEPYVDSGKVELILHDVDEAPDLALYGERVPVLLRNGKVLAEGRFNRLSLSLKLLLA